MNCLIIIFLCIILFGFLFMKKEGFTVDSSLNVLDINSDISMIPQNNMIRPSQTVSSYIIPSQVISSQVIPSQNFSSQMVSSQINQTVVSQKESSSMSTFMSNTPSSNIMSSTIVPQIIQSKESPIIPSIDSQLYSSVLDKPYEINSNSKKIASGLEITGPILNKGEYPPTKNGTILKCSGNASDYYMMIKNKLRKFPNIFTAFSWDPNYISSNSFDCSRTIKDDTEVDPVYKSQPYINETIRCKKDYLNDTVKYYKVKSEDNYTLIYPYEATLDTKLVKIYDCDNFKDSIDYYTYRLLSENNVHTDYKKDISECDGVNITYNGIHYCFPYKVDNNGQPVLYDVREIFDGKQAKINSRQYIVSGINIDDNGPKSEFNIKGTSVIDNCNIKILQVYQLEDTINNKRVLFPIHN